MNHFQSLNRNIQQGFTLVELLIVVIILAILAAIVVPQFSAATDDAKLSALDTTLANMRSSIDLYYQQHGKYRCPAGLAPGHLGMDASQRSILPGCALARTVRSG